jgi:Fur family iron response transcriptional regulator
MNKPCPPNNPIRPYAGIAAQLRGAGLRPTRQRLALAKLLFTGPDRHVTAESLCEEAHTIGVRVSLATVYNCLNQFTESGLLRQVVVDGTRTYFDTNTSEHHHFFRESSLTLTDIPGGTVQVDGLPTPPPGARIARVEVIVRLVDDDVAIA